LHNFLPSSSHVVFLHSALPRISSFYLVAFYPTPKLTKKPNKFHRNNQGFCVCHRAIETGTIYISIQVLDYFLLPLALCPIKIPGSLRTIRKTQGTRLSCEWKWYLLSYNFLTRPQQGGHPVLPPPSALGSSNAGM
jgi:hypothetical protein